VSINKHLMPIVAIVTLLGAIITARAIGAWQTSGRDMIDPTVPLTSADIKGWMPLEYLMERLDLSQGELYEMLGLPANTPPGTPLKEMEDILEVSEVRAIIAVHLGETPAEHSETAAPDPAATPASAGSTDEHTPGTGTGPTPLPPGQVLLAAEIKGRMTLQEISDGCGVPLETLYDELHLSKDISPTTALKDIKAQIADFEVQAVRDVVSAYQSK
jgi:hypothetical protein